MKLNNKVLDMSELKRPDLKSGNIIMLQKFVEAGYGVARSTTSA